MRGLQPSSALQQLRASKDSQRLMGSGAREVRFEALPGRFCPFLALVLAICVLGVKIQSPGKIFQEGSIWNYLSMSI